VLWWSALCCRGFCFAGCLGEYYGHFRRWEVAHRYSSNAEGVPRRRGVWHSLAQRVAQVASGLVHVAQRRAPRQKRGGVGGKRLNEREMALPILPLHGCVNKRRFYAYPKGVLPAF